MIMKFIRENYKKITIVTFIMAFSLLAFSKINSSYADTTTKEFTRKELQDMVIATATSYLRNNTYSDYDQHAMDQKHTYNGTSIDTFNWRDFNITPEMVSRTNTYHNDCSSFTGEVLLSSINYDFSEYYKYTSNLFYVFNNFNYTKSQSSKSSFIEGYKKTGKSISTYFFNNLAKQTANVSAGTEYKNDSGVVNYYYEYTGNETEEKLDTVVASVKSRLQPGDVVVYRHGASKGHVMIYAGDFYNNDGAKINGFIHSTGTSYNFTTETMNRDKAAVITATIENKVDKIIKKTDPSDATTSYMILRPINYYCSSNNSCTVQVTNNAVVRPALTDLKIEQYVKTDTKDVGKYNSVNINENITYNLSLQNIKNETIKNLTITATTPTNTSYVSCNNDCTYDDKTNEIKWVLKEDSTITNNTYSYTVTINKEGTIKNSGFKIKVNNGSTLDMGVLETQANPTINNKLSKNTITSMLALSNTLNQSGYLTYSSTSTSDQAYKTDINSINENNKIALSSVDFVKFLYYNIYGIDLNTLNKDNIKTSLFNTSNNLYTKKTTSTDEISKMLVPGLYGGRLLLGNDNNDRTRNMVATDLEFGDILVQLTTNVTLIKIYVYLGQQDDYPTFVRLSTDNKIESISGQKAQQLFDSTYAKDLFAVLRPTRYYATTVTLKTKEGLTPLIVPKNGTYKNLPIIEKKYTVTYEYNTTVSEDYPKQTTVDDIFDGWYKDDTKVTEQTKLLQETPHTLTEKYSNKKIKLPTPIKDGYEFKGWYTESTLENKVGNDNNEYTPEKDLTLYAKWEAKEPEKEFEITSDSFTIKDNNIYLTEKSNQFTSYIEKLKYDKTFNYELKLYDENNKQITNNIVFTGSRIKAMNNETVIKEYINIVKGDVNKTGTVTMADVMKLADYLLDESKITEDYNLKAGDVNGTNTVTMADVMKLADYILNGGDLQWKKQ